MFIPPINAKGDYTTNMQCGCDRVSAYIWCGRDHRAPLQQLCNNTLDVVATYNFLCGRDHKAVIVTTT